MLKSIEHRQIMVAYLILKIRNKKKVMQQIMELLKTQHIKDKSK